MNFCVIKVPAGTICSLVSSRLVELTEPQRAYLSVYPPWVWPPVESKLRKVYSTGKLAMEEKIIFIHWNEEEAKEKISYLESIGYEVRFEVPQGQSFLKEVRNNPPDVFVIDLSRLPSQGRDFGMAFRHAKSTRHIPIVFAGGDPEKIEKVKEQLPDAVYSSWLAIEVSLKEAIHNPPENPVVPDSLLAGYSGKPLVEKLGIKPDMKVTLIDPPKDFRRVLGGLPSGVQIQENVESKKDLMLWFVRTENELLNHIKRMSTHTGKGGMWICWPKKVSGVQSDVNQQSVREAGLANGLVDYKICSIDKVWSGLLFSGRKINPVKKLLNDMGV